MTILEYIHKLEVANRTMRLEKMEHLQAPPVVIEREKELLQRALENRMEIHNASMLGCLEYVSCDSKVGNGGKSYLQFECTNGEKVNYFPQAKYGPCLFLSK